MANGHECDSRFLFCLFAVVLCIYIFLLQFKLLKYHTHSISGFNEANTHTHTQTSSFTSEKIKIPNEIRFLILLVAIFGLHNKLAYSHRLNFRFHVHFNSIQFAWCKPKSGWQRMKNEEKPLNPAIKSLFAWKHRYKCPYSANILN